LKQFICVDYIDSGLDNKQIFKYNSGDKIILPVNMLKHFSHLNQSIFTLKLSNPKYSTEVHVGVLDFLAPDRIAYIPSWIMHDLCACSGDKLDVDIVDLQKATKVCFKVSKNLLDPKSCLEYLLSKHVILYTNKILKAKIFDKEFVFTVENIEPTSPVIICNSDVELQIIN
jgi:hypothetical protein